MRRWHRIELVSFMVLAAGVAQSCGLTAPGTGRDGGTTTPTTPGDGGAPCAAPEVACGDRCVDPATDPLHCGASDGCEGERAGVACAEGERCVGGACVSAPCPGEQERCGGACVDLATDAASCGACGAACAGAANATSACEGGACVLACDLGWEDANGDPADGCERSSLIVWLDASALHDLADGALVASWPDSSGNGHDAAQLNPFSQPRYLATAAPGGRPAVSFDGIDDTLQTDRLQLFKGAASALTIAIVFRAHDLSRQRFLLMQPQVNCIDNLELGYRTGDQDRPCFGLHAGCRNATVTVSDLDDAWTRAIVRVDGQGASPSNVTIRRDGADEAVEKDALGWTSAGLYGAELRKLLIGGRDDEDDGFNYNSFHDGEIAEILIYDVALAPREIDALDGYLAERYPD